ARAGEEVVRGKWRKMRGNLRITNLASRPMLLPVWIMAYRYRDQVFRFLANGQSGRSTGQAPVSYRKIGAAIAIAAIIILLILLWLFAASGGFRRGGPRGGRVLGIPGSSPLGCKCYNSAYTAGDRLAAWSVNHFAVARFPFNECPT